MRHLITVTDLSSSEIEQVFAITEDLKSKYLQGLREPLLPGRVMALLFEKPSLRTRVSFETAMVHLGGGSLLLGDDAGFGARETIADFGRVLSQYVDTIVVRANRHARVVELADYCSCSVINGLTDHSHPCQALADLYTLRELVGDLSGHTLAFIGDANNVARSLIEGCALVGMRMVMATPQQYRFSDETLDELAAAVPDCNFEVTDDPVAAVRDATAVYTDVWTSMGQESEAQLRRKHFSGFQVNAELMKHAPRAFFMHCLPAHRGEEVTDEVIDGPQSVVVQQAGNRLHVQKGILAWLLSRGEKQDSTKRPSAK
jgi:ornithine carbamoyltransferase